ncbi:hypothetical protein VTL71DRAFT_10447 [Oculimacula yallundae]|uniref:Uncharacterized protein n=1 Tax=Oculimacula yallundae TaxID=86028 RepID=A0ABR4CTM2_9HELO
MKFTTPLLALATLATSAQACIRIHVVQGNAPFEDDGMRIQLWDNDAFYETQRQTKGSASADDHWYFSLGGGHYNVDLWNNGKEGTVTLPDGYKGWFWNKLQQCEKNCYLWGENGCKASGLIYEYASDDNFVAMGGTSRVGRKPMIQNVMRPMSRLAVKAGSRRVERDA